MCNSLFFPSQITPGSDVKMVSRESREEIDGALVAYTPAERQFSVMDYYQRARVSARLAPPWDAIDSVLSPTG